MSYNPEADEISLEDLEAAAGVYDRWFMHPTAVDHFGGNRLSREPANSLHYADKIKLFDYEGNSHPRYEQGYVKGFSVGGLYCWFVVYTDNEWYTFMAVSVRGTFMFDGQRYTVVKAEE